MTSLSNIPSAQAFDAFMCEAIAYSSCAVRLMPLAFAIFSAESPIDSPVERSAMAGGFGARSFGRNFEKILTFDGKSLAAFAAIINSTKRSEYVTGGFDRESAPPAITMSASPSAMAWAAFTTVCVDVAQARVTE